jgi:hypothetical protein
MPGKSEERATSGSGAAADRVVRPGSFPAKTLSSGISMGSGTKTGTLVVKKDLRGFELPSDFSGYGKER